MTETDRTETTYTDMPASYWKEQALMAWREVNKFSKALKQAREETDEARRWARRMKRGMEAYDAENEKLIISLFETRCSICAGGHTEHAYHCASCGKPLAGVPPLLTRVELEQELNEWKNVCRLLARGLIRRPPGYHDADGKRYQRLALKVMKVLKR